MLIGSGSKRSPPQANSNRWISVKFAPLVTIRGREQLPYEVERGWWEGRQAQAEARLAKIASDIEAIDAQDAAEAEKHREREQLKQRVYELARARVLDFVGAPDAQMKQAGRLWRHCCDCGKELTDPLSLERGIGPDCYQHQINGIKHFSDAGTAVNLFPASSACRSNSSMRC
jgi:hypothetical protein